MPGPPRLVAARTSFAPPADAPTTRGLPGGPADGGRPVYVLDDDPAVRTVVRRVLGDAGRDARGYGSAGEGLAAVRAAAPECVVVDCHLPDGTGLDVQAVLAAEAPAVPVVFMSGGADAEVAIRAFRAGAVDFLLKPFEPQALVAAAARAAAVGARRRAALAERTAREELARRYGRLTGREREVLALVAEGRLNKQAAARLGVTERTVKTHRARVMRKMGAGSLAELVRMCDRLARGDA